MTKSDFIKFIEAVEQAHFSTVQDTGANWNAMFIWNIVRARAGLKPLSLSDLDAYCETCKKYHKQPVPCPIH